MSDATHEALVELGILLGQSGYEFVTVTPATHARVDARDERRGRAMARDLRDVFGWSRPFIREAVPSRVFDLLKEAQVLRREGEGYRSNVRFSTLGGQLHVHSAFPTQDADSASAVAFR